MAPQYHEVFLCEIQHKRRGRIVSWCSSSTGALAELRRLRRELTVSNQEGDGPSGVSCIKVPTDRAGLIGWLNEHAKHCRKPSLGKKK